MMKWLYFCIIFFTTVKSNVIYEISSENVQYNTQTQTEIIATKKPLFDFLTTFCENLIPKVIRDPECADQLQFICIRQDVLLQSKLKSTTYYYFAMRKLIMNTTNSNKAFNLFFVSFYYNIILYIHLP